MSDKQRILLETGTNEVEIVDFGLGGQSFGVNVAKVRQILPFDTIDIHQLPGTHQSVAGVFLLRGDTVPLVDLAGYLEIEESEDTSQRVVIVTEFNRTTTAFCADEIHRIYRVSWERFQPLSAYLRTTSAPHVVGTMSLDGREVLVLDLEHIIGEIFPASIINYTESETQTGLRKSERQQCRVLFAEDSMVIRKQVTSVLGGVGFTNMDSFENGLEAYDAVKARLRQMRDTGERDLTRPYDLVLLDIEMPQMDGLTLCRRLKQELNLTMPVIMFSSLINEQMIAKCIKVGADNYISKPETEKLIRVLDGYAKEAMELRNAR